MWSCRMSGTETTVPLILSFVVSYEMCSFWDRLLLYSQLETKMEQASESNCWLLEELILRSGTSLWLSSWHERTRWMLGSWLLGVLLSDHMPCKEQAVDTGHWRENVRFRGQIMDCVMLLFSDHVLRPDQAVNWGGLDRCQTVSLHGHA